MRVTERGGPGQVTGTGGVRRSGSTSSSFSLGGTDGPQRASSASAAASMGAMDGLLSVQVAGDALERRRRAMRRGHTVLDQLDQLKIALLSGTINPQALENIRQSLKQQRETTDDPNLEDLLAHIDLRAEVELAKLRR
jgi:Class II flagellar assembly regulator